MKQMNLQIGVDGSLQVGSELIEVLWWQDHGHSIHVDLATDKIQRLIGKKATLFLDTREAMRVVCTGMIDEDELAFKRTP